MSRRLKAAHHLLVYPRWPIRTFRPAVQPFVLPVLHVNLEIPVRSDVALELVGDQDTRRAPVPLESFTRHARDRMPATAPLHQYFEHRTVLVHSAPQPVLLVVDGECDFVNVPLSASG
jgi:hypothetical protein